MNQTNNAVCAICGKEYYMCMSCKETRSLHPWKLHTDTSEHYKIYQVLRGYTTGKYSRLETEERLNNIDLSDLNTLKDNIRNTINDIMRYAEKDTQSEQISVSEEKDEDTKSDKLNKRKKTYNKNDK